jgi:hypothetical protein
VLFLEAFIHFVRMSIEEKERIMFDFRTGEIHILVATTVIEVGVDPGLPRSSLAEGTFRAEMHVHLVNDSPITIWLDTDDL